MDADDGANVESDKRNLSRHYPKWTSIMYIDPAQYFPDYMAIQAPKHISLPRQYWFKSPSDEIYSANIGDDCHVEIIRAEARSLYFLRRAARGLVPLSNDNPEYFQPGRNSVVPHQPRRNFVVPHQPFMVCDFGHFDPNSSHRWTLTSAAALGKRLANEVHAYSGTATVFGTTLPVFYRGIKIIDNGYQSWKECYETLIVNLLSHLKSEEHPKLLRGVKEVIERYVINTKIEQGHPPNHWNFTVSSLYSWTPEG